MTINYRDVNNWNGQGKTARYRGEQKGNRVFKLRVIK
jgi:hypothetical protein